MVREPVDAAAIFSRQVGLWGSDKQEVLGRSALLVAGLGGVGCTVAEILVRCGVGRLLLVDNKPVDPPDLGRQSLYTLDDLGERKTTAARARLSRLTGLTELLCFDETVEELDLAGPGSPCDGVLDCLDNFPARFSLEERLRPDMFMVHGAVSGSFGQVTTIVRGRTATLRDLYASMRQPREPEPVPVAAPIVYGLAVIMAQEALNNLWGSPGLRGELLLVDMGSFFFYREKLLG